MAYLRAQDAAAPADPLPPPAARHAAAVVAVLAASMLVADAAAETGWRYPC